MAVKEPKEVERLASQSTKLKNVDYSPWSRIISPETNDSGSALDANNITTGRIHIV
jgi:hypothetical protein